MIITSIAVGELEVNCYLVTDNQTKQTYIIDPGAEPEKIISEIKKQNYKIAGIINTHGHVDHIGANSHLKKTYNCPIYIHSLDAKSLIEPEINLPIYGGKICSPPADNLLKDGDIINFGKSSLKVLHTQGHTPGSICLIGDNCIFTGDTLFCGSVGRCDLPGGNEKLLMDSIKKLVELSSPEWKIFSGHGPESTISDELKHNPFLCLKTNI